MSNWCLMIGAVRRKKKATSIAVLAAVLATSSNPVLGSVLLSFEGTVDLPGNGYKVGGVEAPLGSPFTLDIEIDNSMAATGVYAINSISYTLVVGTYTTVTDWTGIVELVATQAGPSISLVSDPLFVNPDEAFLLILSGFGPSSFDDPTSWQGPSLVTGDIHVRGVGDGSADQLSGAGAYSGALVLAVDPPDPPDPQTLYSIDQGSALLRVIDPATAATVSSLPIALAGETVTGGTGLATKPGANELWGLLKLSGQSGRELATIDPVTGVATSIGDTDPLALGHRFAGIAFNGVGSTLYAVSGEGSSPDPESLYTLSQSDGSPTFVCALGNGTDGETIGWNRDDGTLYHASGHVGDGFVIFETIDNAPAPVGILAEIYYGLGSCSVTDIPITTPLTDEETQAITYWDSQGVFLWKQNHSGGPLFRVTATGTPTLIGDMDHQAKGLAFLGGGCGEGVAVEQGPIDFDGDTYYRLSNSNWTNAECAAVALGGHLVTINDAAENDFVLNTFANAPGSGPVWLGLNDAAVEGTFVWVSGEPFVYSNWERGEPNNNGDEDYVHMYSPDGRWNDAMDLPKPPGIGNVYGVVEVNTCPWDCGGDNDGDVGIVDFLALLAEWDLVDTPCDFDGGGVGIVDLLKLLANWGPCVP